MFVTFEGIDGSGKSSVIKEVAKAATQQGFDVVVTKEPGGTLFGERICKVLAESDKLSADTEALLFLADRAEHINAIITPALLSNKFILCDRYVDSTKAYQEWYKDSGIIFTPVPDITILLDVPVDVAEKRISERDQRKVGIEERARLIRVRDNYLQIAEQNPGRIRIVDANSKLSEVVADCICELHLVSLPKQYITYHVEGDFKIESIYSVDKCIYAKLSQGIYCITVPLSNLDIKTCCDVLTDSKPYILMSLTVRIMPNKVVCDSCCPINKLSPDAITLSEAYQMSYGE